MVIQPKVRGFLCTTTHPTGCYENVRRQAEHVRSKGDIADGPKRVLVLGASTGYGLASRITAAFGSGASTIGVFFEKPGQTASRAPPAGTTQPASTSWRMRRASTPRA
jgi:enoyl-[acyl-carrier protein] reductase/trans-2-enoyl-CoA reductase (NAD+)